MADTEVSEEIWTPDGADAREQLRVALHESAVAMNLEEVEGRRDASESGLRHRIAALGFEGDAAKVFDLLPLVHVAWADGTVQANERAEILRLLRIRDLPMGQAYETMLALLETPPSESYVDASLAVLREVIERGRGPRAETVVGLCIMVAEAAGGFLGMFNRISPEEREAIEQIAESLGQAAVDEVRRRLG